MRRVAGRQAGSTRATDRKHGLYLFFDDEFKVLLDAAAEMRDMSLTGYARRAVAAFIAHDLGIPFEDVAKHAAQPNNYGSTNRRGPIKTTHDNGRGHGDWRIGGLEGET